MGFFRLESPIDMLEKAGRERDRMVSDVHVDHVYNFFVMAAHVADYVKHSGAVEQRPYRTLLTSGSPPAPPSPDRGDPAVE